MQQVSGFIYQPLELSSSDYIKWARIATSPIKGRLDCDSRRILYATLEATQTRRTDLWEFTLLL